MTELFALPEEGQSLATLSGMAQPSTHTSVLIGDRLLFADTYRDRLGVLHVGATAAEPNSNNSTQQTAFNPDLASNTEGRVEFIPLPETPLSCLQHLLHVPSPDPQPQLLLITNLHITRLSLSPDCTRLHQLPRTLPLLPAINQVPCPLVNTQALAFTASAQNGRVLVSGFDLEQRLLVNVYECRGKGEVRPELVGRVRVLYPEQIKNVYQVGYTLGQSVLCLYPIFNEKGLPVLIHTYQLPHFSQLTEVASSSNEGRQPLTMTLHSAATYSLCCVDKYLHLRRVYYHEGDLYILYGKYIPHETPPPHEQTYGECNQRCSEFLWVYNTGMGYTRNLLPLPRPHLQSLLLQSPPLRTLCLLGPGCSTFVKMCPQSYQPHFSTRHQGQLLQVHPQWLLCAQGQGQGRWGVTRHARVAKRVLYCCMWEQLGMGEPGLQQVIAMLG